MVLSCPAVATTFSGKATLRVELNGSDIEVRVAVDVGVGFFFAVQFVARLDDREGAVLVFAVHCVKPSKRLLGSQRGHPRAERERRFSPLRLCVTASAAQIELAVRTEGRPQVWSKPK